MRIYRIRRNVQEDGGPSFDASHGFIVAAESERRARELAESYKLPGDGHRDELTALPGVWHAPTTSCEIVGTAAPGIKEGVLLQDHKWG